MYCHIYNCHSICVYLVSLFSYLNHNILCYVYLLLFFFVLCIYFFFFFFFFSSRRRHTRCSRDWSSDVCSSDLIFIIVSRELIFATVAVFTNCSPETWMRWSTLPRRRT